ncbi:MAG TPA: glycosyltransferase family 2 protein [Bryobacteraceae bacterium]|nr:glycosyltransferase family 2 protein [Bryobacteraceae bacterium]
MIETAPYAASSSGEGTRYLLTPRPNPKKLSIVIPIYNEQAAITFLRSSILQFCSELRGTDVEIVAVNDGSSDLTIEFLQDWAFEDNRLRVVNLSRNFGHQVAATAGLDYATGDAVVLMDADLQDPFSAVHDMIARYREGYDVAYGLRVTRAGESRFKLATAWIFYRLMRVLVYEGLHADVGDFRLISRECLDSLRRLRETHRFLRGMATWVGYPQIAVPYKREQRIAGETKYPITKMLRLAWTAATSFSALPLKLSLYIGVVLAFISFEELIRALAGYFTQHVVPGWASLMVAVTGIGGMLLSCIGILGEYVGKIYEEGKHRPLYLVASVLNSPESRDVSR